MLANAGIHKTLICLDSRLRGNDAEEVIQSFPNAKPAMGELPKRITDMPIYPRFSSNSTASAGFSFEVSAGFAFSSLDRLLSPTGC